MEGLQRLLGHNFFKALQYGCLRTHKDPSNKDLTFMYGCLYYNSLGSRSEQGRPEGPILRVKRKSNYKVVLCPACECTPLRSDNCFDIILQRFFFLNLKKTPLLLELSSDPYNSIKEIVVMLFLLIKQ